MIQKNVVGKYAVSIIYSIVLILISLATYVIYSKNFTAIPWDVQTILALFTCLVGIRLIMFSEKWNWFGVVMAIIGTFVATTLLVNAHP